MNRILIAISMLIITHTSIAEQSNQIIIAGDDYLGVIGQEVVIKFNDKTCTVTTKGMSEKKNEAPEEFTLNFNCGNKTQVLWDINKPNKDDFGFDDAPFEVVWAGDKDNDGKIDIMVNLSPKYSCKKIVSYLSSLAQNNNLLGISNHGKTECF